MAKKRNSTPYDESVYWKNNCQPLVKQLMEACRLGGIPLFICAGVKSDGTTVGYESEVSDKTYIQQVIMPIETGRVLSQDLSQDRIAKHMLVERGYIPVPPSSSIDYDDFDDLDI